MSEWKPLSCALDSGGTTCITSMQFGSKFDANFFIATKIFSPQSIQEIKHLFLTSDFILSNENLYTLCHHLKTGC